WIPESWLSWLRLPDTTLSGDDVSTSMPLAVAFGFSETLPYVVLPDSVLPGDVASPIPCSPLSWLVLPLTVAPVVPVSRMPVERAWSTVAPRTTTPLLQVSTRIPFDADQPAVSWSRVTALEVWTRAPAKFCRRNSMLLTTTSWRPVIVTPKDWAPASTLCPSPGLGP